MECLYDEEMREFMRQNGMQLSSEDLYVKKPKAKRVKAPKPQLHTKLQFNIDYYVQDILADEFRHTLPQSRLLREEAYSLVQLSGWVVECLKPAHPVGSKWSYFSGEATLMVQDAGGTQYRVRASNWPVVDQLLFMNMTAKKLQNGGYLVVNVNYSARMVTEEVLDLLLLHALAGAELKKELKKELKENEYKMLSRHHLLNKLQENHLLKNVFQSSRFFMIGITVKLADVYGRRNMAGKCSADILLLIWHIATVRGEAHKLCFPHLFEDRERELKLPELSLEGYNAFSAYLTQNRLAKCVKLDDCTAAAIQFYQTHIKKKWQKMGHTMLPEPLSCVDAPGGLRYMSVPHEVRDKLVGPPFYALVRYSDSSDLYVPSMNDHVPLRIHVDKQSTASQDKHCNYRYSGPTYLTASCYSRAEAIREGVQRLLQLQAPLIPEEEYNLTPDSFIEEVQQEMRAAEMQLHKAQERALRLAFKRRILCVTGAGGTGKSSVFIHHYKRLRDRLYYNQIVEPEYGGDLIQCELSQCSTETGRSLNFLPTSDRKVVWNTALEILRESTDEDEVYKRLQQIPAGNLTKDARIVLTDLLPWVARNIRTRGAARHFLIVAPTAVAATNLHQYTDGMGETMDMIIKRAKFAPYTIYTNSIKTLVLEETSCCDDSRLAELLACLPNLEQLVLVFDNNQIAPVKAGFVSKDFYDLLLPHDGVVQFTQNYRALREKDGNDKQGARALLTLYEAILQRKPELLSKCATLLPDLQKVSMKQLVQSGRLIGKESVLLADCGENGEVETTVKLYTALREHGMQAQILAHTNRACEALNEACFTALHGNVYKKGVYKVRQPILFTKNFYPVKMEEQQQKCTEQSRKKREIKKQKLSRFFTYGGGIQVEQVSAQERLEDSSRGSHRVCNGEVWQIEAIEPRSALHRDRYVDSKGVATQCVWTSDVKEVDLTRLITTQGGKPKWVYMEDVGADHIRAGDALTGNKSQGDQYTAVIIDLGNKANFYLSLNVLYTMASRCRVLLIIVCNLKRRCLPFGELERVIKEAPRVYRFSGLYRLLQTLDFSKIRVQ